MSMSVIPAHPTTRPTQESRAVLIVRRNTWGLKAPSRQKGLATAKKIHTGIPPSEDEAETRHFYSRRYKTAVDKTTAGVCFARPMQTEKQNDMEKTFGNDPT